MNEPCQSHRPQLSVEQYEGTANATEQCEELGNGPTTKHTAPKSKEKSVPDCAHQKVESAQGYICHSHDFCDANVYMAEAFEHVIGRNVFLPCDTNDDGIIESDCRTMNEAWSIAKRAALGGEP